jgi:hypothetical protein
MTEIDPKSVLPASLVDSWTQMVERHNSAVGAAQFAAAVPRFDSDVFEKVWSDELCGALSESAWLPI